MDGRPGRGAHLRLVVAGFGPRSDVAALCISALLLLDLSALALLTSRSPLSVRESSISLLTDSRGVFNITLELDSTNPRRATLSVTGPGRGRCTAGGHVVAALRGIKASVVPRPSQLGTIVHATDDWSFDEGVMMPLSDTCNAECLLEFSVPLVRGAPGRRLINPPELRVAVGMGMGQGGAIDFVDSPVQVGLPLVGTAQIAIPASVVSGYKVDEAVPALEPADPDRSMSAEDRLWRSRTPGSSLRAYAYLSDLTSTGASDRWQALIALLIGLAGTIFGIVADRTIRARRRRSREAVTSE